MRPSVPAAAELAVEDGVLHPLVVLGVSVALGLVLRLGRAPLAQRLGSLRITSNRAFTSLFDCRMIPLFESKKKKEIKYNIHGGPSGPGAPFDDFKLKVPLHFKLKIHTVYLLNGNSYCNVNKRLCSSRWTTLCFK